MARLKVLICGGGCAGPALAFWLARCGHRVSVVERYPDLRATGAQIDLRAQGIDAVKRMGLLDRVRSQLVDEAGVAIVDSSNRPWGIVMANTSGRGAQSVTSEYEIMRGDLVRILYDVTKDDVDYIFGKTIDSFEQDAGCVTVTFSDGHREQYDIMVGADGQNSRTRKAILPQGADPLVHLGFHMAYYCVSRTAIDNNIRKVYMCPSRWVMSRTHNPYETQAYLTFRDDSEATRSIHRAPTEQQKKFWTDKFGNVGWQTKRFLDGMQDTDNFYSQEVVQVKTNTWYHNRVVLLGDAAHCPSPMSGMGTTSAFVGAYVLAGEIQRNSDNLSAALANYDKVMRPFAEEFQKLNMPLRRLAFPETMVGVWLLRCIVAIVCFLRIPELKSRFSSEENGGWRLPDYPELSAQKAACIEPPSEH